MHSEIPGMLSNLRRLTLPELQREYAKLCGEPTRIAHKAHLIKRIIWRIQASKEGDLSERARRRAIELADDACIRLRPPATKQDATSITAAFNPSRNPKQPAVGTVLRRVYKGNTILVRVLEKGFEFDGERYRSLTAIATKLSGAHWNGFAFFSLNQHAKQPAGAGEAKGAGK